MRGGWIMRGFLLFFFLSLLEIRSPSPSLWFQNLALNIPPSCSLADDSSRIQCSSISTITDLKATTEEPLPQYFHRAPIGSLRPPDLQARLLLDGVEPVSNGQLAQHVLLMNIQSSHEPAIGPYCFSDLGPSTRPQNLPSIKGPIEASQMGSDQAEIGPYESFSCEMDHEFLKLNPFQFVPVLVDGDSEIYLEDKYPHHHPLLPHDIHRIAINLQVQVQC
ncbi:hypothetical protein VNO77_02864 [Canavalia gladiata]|uniref:Uncharacterized protein n=1 Tax=Canavalia gladiata TaxID=3824 RepID=A0AAN9N080_CANGL